MFLPNLFQPSKHADCGDFDVFDKSCPPRLTRDFVAILVFLTKVVLPPALHCAGGFDGAADIRGCIREM